MIHRYTFIHILALGMLATGAQAQGVGQGVLDLNNVDALFHSNGLISENTETFKPHFFVPKQVDQSGPSTLYASGLWVAGLAPNGDLHVAAQLYDTDGFDYAPGPLTIGDASITPGVSLAYDQVRVVYQNDVALHLAYFDCLADPECDLGTTFPGGYTTPAYFYDYPAMGDVGSGQARYLAPFHDHDQDGMYDPDNGDAPCLPGDKALFMIFNDKTAPHTQSLGAPIGLEVHMTPFAYSSPHGAINETVFIRYHIINRSLVALHDCYVGVFNDFDLGCGDDDFIGTDVGRNLVYVYNWDENDQSCQSGIPGYDTPPPAFGMTVLKGPLLDANGVDDAPANTLPSWNGSGFGDGDIDNERTGLTGSLYFSRNGNSVMNDPAQPTHYYNYLRSIWKDGTPQSYGGTGYSGSSGAVPSSFIFPGDSDPLGVGSGNAPQPAWQESAQADPDRRILGSMGPFTLGAGAEDEIVVAYVYAQGPDRLASVAALRQRVDSVRAFAALIPGVMTEGEPCDALPTDVQEHAQVAESLMLFPNPAMEQVSVMMGRISGKGTVQVVDATGREVLRSTTASGRRDLDVKDLAPGIYTVLAYTEGMLRYGRFVKQ